MIHESGGCANSAFNCIQDLFSKLITFVSNYSSDDEHLKKLKEKYFVEVGR